MTVQLASEPDTSAQQVSLVQVSVTEPAHGGPGALTVQVLVDKELKEYVVRATPDDAAMLVEFLAHTTQAGWDKSGRWAEACFMST